MKVGSRPTDEQILAALKRAGPRSPTYVIRNWLADREFGRFDALNTSHVLYRLKKLDRAGRVRRVLQSYYSGMHAEWEVIE